MCVQGTVGTSDISLAATTTPAKPQPGGGRAAPPPAGGSSTVPSTPGGRTRFSPASLWPLCPSVRAFALVALAIAAPEAPSSCPPLPRDMIQPKPPFVHDAVRPRLCAHLPLVYRSVRTHDRPAGHGVKLGTPQSQAFHRLRCAALVRRRKPPRATYSAAQQMHRPCRPAQRRSALPRSHA